MSDSDPRPTDEGASENPQSDAAATPMRLRAEPPRVMRLSRRALATIGVVAGVVLGGSLIYALRGAERAVQTDELFSIDRRPTADGLVGLPRDYTGVPQLGPALPGDLGRAMVGMQDRGQAVTAPGAHPMPGADPDEQVRL